MKSITLFDSSLRDGAQAEGISFSVNDKLEIVRALDAVGIHYIEAGNPASNPKELAFFEQATALQLEQAKLCAFGSTRRKNILPQDDDNCVALLRANTPAVAIFGKSSLLHVEQILQTTAEENLAMIKDTCAFFTAHGKELIFDAEHFFDGYKLDADYAMQSLQAAVDGGAAAICLCDTNGGAFPWEISDIVQTVCNAFPRISVGIHAHNDGDMATASSVAAVLAGASQVQGTFLGFGERVGNACLAAIVPNLQLKLHYDCISPAQMKQLTQTALHIASIANTTVSKNTPFIGSNAFAHKAGMHVDGVRKLARSFEHIDPALVGNQRDFLISEVTGKAAVLKRVRDVFPDTAADSIHIPEVLTRLKNREFDGYTYEGADASFDLLIRAAIGNLPQFFELTSYTVLTEKPYSSEHSATATIKIRIDGQNEMVITADEGEGPVNALDKALRKALNPYYPVLKQVELLDYKVRIMESSSGTDTKVRVLITSGDGARTWTTVGVSHDIIEASWEALVESIQYKLIEQKGE
ncbi:MAG: citramalate synthase [Oscillospiraceae bacterium]|jgi:2-isopropylmalate synthase|nr:citramalate synthase [Oscillospiraceae bacterium]